MSKTDRFVNGSQITKAGDVGNIDANAVVQEAEKAHQESKLRELQVLEAGEQSAEFRYLVRGASLKCSCGTHTRKLNLPMCHGVYVGENPMINEEDCVVGDDQNITAFGVCESEGHPDKTPFWLSVVGTLCGFGGLLKSNKNRKKILLQKDDGTNVRGYACTPCIVSGWKDVHETQTIARNHTDGSHTGDRLAVVTEESFLVCAYGGIIEPITSGQEEGTGEVEHEHGGEGKRR